MTARDEHATAAAARDCLRPPPARASGVGSAPAIAAASHDRAARLREAIASLRGDGEGREAVDLTPKSAHEAITRQMVADLAADLAEVKSRVNAVLWLVAGAVIVDVAMRLAGVS